MKNWLKNLLFVLFSFTFLGVGIVVAEFFIREKGNPLKDPTFLAETPSDTTMIISNITTDSTTGWETDSAIVIEKPLPEPKKEIRAEDKKPQSGDYQVIIGIFSERSNANREVKKLKALGYSEAHTYTKSSMDVVCAGLFDKSRANQVASELKNKGFDTIVKHQ
ncbi:MAG: SPOR domain-containing protein [Arcicella sp.]|nr:SPOR domain-containing protein [Arcicella sp.]